MQPSPDTLKGGHRTIIVRNHQRGQHIDLRLLRKMAVALVGDLWPGGNCDLGIHIITRPEIVRLNQGFLHHAGSTDVITFNYSSTPHTDTAQGEIFICLAEAIEQARHFRTTWQAELVRYVVHGILHILGYDDVKPAARRKMKRAEDRLVRKLACRFPFRQLGQKEKRHSP